MADPQGIVIPEAVIEKLRERVQMQGEEEIRAFVTDALNTYVALGSLVVGGAELQLRNPKDGSTRRVRLPFEARGQAAGAAPAAPAAGAAPAGKPEAPPRKPTTSDARRVMRET